MFARLGLASEGASKRRAAAFGPLCGLRRFSPRLLVPAVRRSVPTSSVRRRSCRRSSKRSKGWKIATPRANEPKGEWWSVFHDPELDQLMRVVAVSNQTIKADEANYRQALALINEARAGLFPTCQRHGFGDARLAWRHEFDRGSDGGVDPRRLGSGPARDRGAAGGRGDERRRSRERVARRAIGARARLCNASPGGFARGPARQDDRRLQAFGHDHAKPV